MLSNLAAGGGRRVETFESRTVGGTGGSPGGGPGGASGGQSFFRNSSSSSSSSSRTGPDGRTTGQRSSSSSRFQSGGSSASGSSIVNRFSAFRDEDDIYSNRVSASSLVPVAAKNPTIKNLLGLMNIRAKTYRSGFGDTRQLAASTLNEILAKTGASLLGRKAYAPRPLPRVKMSVS